MLMKRLVAGAATAAIALSITAVAHAQSTAGQAQEVIVTGTRTPRSTGGLATQVNEAKDQSIIGHQYIETQVPSANIGQLINALPGVSYSTEDPGGFNSGDLRVHGFDGAHVAVILDGAPLNDTGNYAVYPGEYIIGELIDHITVNIGGSDVDTPSASALGATINVVTKKPKNDFGGQVSLSGGSYGYNRAYAEVDTGRFGPWDTTAFVGGEYGFEDNFQNRPGYSRRYDFSGRVYQPLKGDDFLSVAGIFTSERQYPAFRISQSTINSAGRYFIGDNYTWVPETATPGKADLIPGTTGATATNQPGGSDVFYYNLYPNPVDFASIRGQSKFTLGHGLTLTADPSFFYTLANGGGGALVKENDKRLIGNATNANANSHACVAGGAVTGVDLNGDGDCLDQVVAYGPSNTQTYRYSLTSSLLWDLNEHHHFQLSYTGDLGLHRQTGEYTYVSPANGAPNDVFGAHPGYGTPIATADPGVSLRTRDRRSVAILNQVSLNYIGKFMDDRLHLNVGVRAPFFERKLNNFCYTYNGSSFDCDSVNPAAVQTAYNTDLAAKRATGATATALTSLLGIYSSTSGGATNITTGANGRPNFAFPGHSDFNFDKVLPNAGVSYRIAENHLLYASYAAGFAAPKTDDLYLSSTDLVRPETSDNYALGYRYQTRPLNVSINFYDNEYHNRIVQSVDPLDPTLSIDRNVGNVRVYGVDLEAGWTPIENLHVYGSANFNKSELESNINVGVVTGGQSYNVVLPTKGKELVLTPDRIFNLRVTYDMGPITVGVQGRYMSSRYLSDTNDTQIGGYAVFGFDARYNLPYLNNHSYIQLNVQNLFNRDYFSRATTFNTGTNIPVPGTNVSFFGSSPSYYIGAPSSFTLTLHGEF